MIAGWWGQYKKSPPPQSLLYFTYSSRKNRSGIFIIHPLNFILTRDYLVTPKIFGVFITDEDHMHHLE